VIVDAAAGKYGQTKSSNSIVSAAVAPVSAIRADEPIKIHFSNGSYKTFNATATTTAGELSKAIADKINMTKWAPYLEIFEMQRQTRRRHRIESCVRGVEVITHFPFVVALS
jgi:hypothetical protein